MKNTLLVLLLFSFYACNKKISLSQIPVVTADIETVPVSPNTEGDAADDAAIWVNPQDARKSIIIGTVKNFGLEVYNLQGQRLHAYPIGSPNNIDLRYNFPLQNGKKVDIVACSERTTNEIRIFSIEPSDFSLKPLSEHRLKSSVDEVYGICLYQSPLTKQYHVFVNGKNGIIEQWQLAPFGDAEITGKVVRTLQVASQPEGMVADDRMQTIYIGEEDKGIWKFLAEPDQPATMRLLTKSGEDNPNIKYDVEGLTIYYKSKDKGYLLASSQGNNSYAVFEREGDNHYLGSFSINNDKIDGTAETDGIDVTAQTLGEPFGSGLFIVQDGFNTDESGKPLPQNFKLIAWKKIEKIIKSFKK